jgi:hypothetical protein
MKMTKVLPLTALELIADRSIVASNVASARRDRCETRRERDMVDQKSYNMGEAAAYNDARTIMEKELRRLCNKFQNGSLTVADFGIVL